MKNLKPLCSTSLVWLICAMLLTLLSSCSTPPVRPSPPVRSTHIDTAKIDRLLQLIDARLAIARMVAQAKRNADLPIDDPAREENILKQALSEASSRGVPESLVRNFFQDQFAASKLLQLRLHEEWQRKKQPPFSAAPNLNHDIRPVLDRITPQLIVALHDVQKTLANEEGRQYFLNRAKELVRNDFDGAPRALALRSLQNN
ncbi:MAG: gamma subclass chorismate mutase AroQ [Pseudomonadota bacterium]